MSKKKKFTLKVNSRIPKQDVNYLLNPNEIKASRKEEYNRMIVKLNNNLKSEIYNVVERIKILSKISKDRLYFEGGFKSFREFLRMFKLAKTQAYVYVKLGIAIESGAIEEEYIINNGIQASITHIKTNENVVTGKPNEENLIKPLKLRLKNKEIYDFYKENTKFTEFFLESLFLSEKDLIKKFKKRFTNQ
ncbi:chromosome replication/partitioning protein [Borreliella burgdorferi]|uniref:chromosome replication/partitioning protein n=1 Tax=Borreliella burgdorferi TaxID=139 RepID=UPI003DA5ADAF